MGGPSEDDLHRVLSCFGSAFPPGQTLLGYGVLLAIDGDALLALANNSTTDATEPSGSRDAAGDEPTDGGDLCTLPVPGGAGLFFLFGASAWLVDLDWQALPASWSVINCTEGQPPTPPPPPPPSPTARTTEEPTPRPTSWGNTTVSFTPAEPTAEPTSGLGTTGKPGTETVPEPTFQILAPGGTEPSIPRPRINLFDLFGQ